MMRYAGVSMRAARTLLRAVWVRWRELERERTQLVGWPVVVSQAVRQAVRGGYNVGGCFE